MWVFLLFTSTFAHMVIAFNDTAENGGNIANLAFSLCLIFCGVLATPETFPRFWIFLYRVSPFTYLAEVRPRLPSESLLPPEPASDLDLLEPQGLLATAVGGTQVVCAAQELITFNPPGGQTCGDYMAPYIAVAGGSLVDAPPRATASSASSPTPTRSSRHSATAMATAGASASTLSFQLPAFRALPLASSD